MIEIIIMIGVLWNAGLQTYWFFWSKKIEKRKHFTDGDEIDLHDRVEEYFQLRIHNERVIADRDKMWEEFRATPNVALDSEKNDFIRNQDGKFDYNEIPGALDNLFEPLQQEK